MEKNKREAKDSKAKFKLIIKKKSDNAMCQKPKHEKKQKKTTVRKTQNSI